MWTEEWEDGPVECAEEANVDEPLDAELDFEGSRIGSELEAYADEDARADNLLEAEPFDDDPLVLD